MKKLLMTMVLMPLMAKAVAYPYVATSGASLGVWTTDYDAAVSASRSSGLPIILCTVHNCDHGCAALLTNIPSELASKSYLVCFNKDSGYPGYRADFSILMQRFALNNTYGQAVLLYGGGRAGEIAKKYGATHGVEMASLVAKIQTDYSACVENGSRNVSFSSQNCSAAVSQGKLSFTSSSSAPWQISGESGIYDDKYYSTGQSVRSGLISDGGSSWLETTVTGPGWVSFNWFVSSEENYDGLSFLVDGVYRDTISGEHVFSESDWTMGEFPIAEGSHKLRWEYKKDSSVSKGLDGAWIADVVWIKKQDSFTSYRTSFSSHDIKGHFPAYPVVMDPGEASGDQRLYEGLPMGDYPAPTCPYSREGYRFAGWNYYSACYYGEDSFLCKGINCGGLVGLRQAGNVLDICGVSALVATWEPIASYTITFNANGGSCSTSSKQYSSGSTLGTLPTATRSGYVFDGWYTSSSGGSKVTSSTTVNKAVTYYAHWKEAETEAPEVFDDGNIWFKLGEDVSWFNPFCIAYELPVTVKVTGLPSGVGYRWDGELVRLTGRATKAGVFQVTCTATDTKGRKSSSTISMVIEVETVEVVFDVNGGDSEISSRYVEQGKSIGTLPTPVRSKYKFLGWYTQPEGGTKISSSTKVKEEAVYYAHWQYDGSVYVRTSISEGCEGMGTVSGGNKSVKGGSSATLTAKASKGYVFCQWVPIGMSAEQEDEFYETHDVYNPTLKMPVGSSDMSFEAYFIPVADDVMCLWGYEEWNNAVGVPLRTADSLWDYERHIEIEGGSLPKFSVSGLPSGIKYTVRNWCIGFTGKPTKEGTYWVICTAKNASGYQATGIIKWVIGNPKPTDYDNIGLNKQSNAWMQMCSLLVGREIGDSLNVDEWACEYCGGEITKWAISGLPNGLKLQQNCHGRYVITGMPTKAGKYTLTITATYADKHTAKAAQTIVVEGGECGSAYVKVAVAPGQEYMGTASGGGVCARASKAKLTAKANKGYVFAGWYDEDGDRWWNTDSGDWRKASDSYVVRADEWPEFYARFVPGSSDQSISIRCPSEWNVECSDVGNLLYDACSFDVDSASLPTVTASGLPSGCKFDKVNMRLVFEKQPQKPGISKVTIKAKNVSGATDEKVIYVKVPNLRSDVFDGIDYDRDYRVPQYDSMACDDCWLSFGVQSGWTVTASGLPSGLKLVKDDYGYGSFMRVVGTATRAGAYTVTLTAKRGGVSEKATFTIIVDPLPSYAVGTFNGVLSGECYDCGDSRGTFTMTSTSSGKLSATLITEYGEKHTFSANSWSCISDEECSAYFTKKVKSDCWSGEQYIFVTVRRDSTWDGYQLTGDFLVDACSVGGEGEIVAQRNPFGKVGKDYENWEAHSIAATLAGYGKISVFVLGSDYGGYELACPNCIRWEWGVPKPDLTFTVNVNGAVKVAGKIGGKSVSGSSTLRIIDGEPQADFMFSVSKTPISIHVGFELGYGANGAAYGSARVGW